MSKLIDYTKLTHDEAIKELIRRDKEKTSKIRKQYEKVKAIGKNRKDSEKVECSCGMMIVMQNDYSTNNMRRSTMMKRRKSNRKANGPLNCSSKTQYRRTPNVVPTICKKLLK